MEHCHETCALTAFCSFFLHMLHCHKTCALFVLSKSCIVMKHALFKPAHGIMVLIEYANSDGSDSPTHPRSLSRPFAIYSIKLEEGLYQSSH